MKILCVEDRELILEGLTKSLMRAGHSVVGCSCRKEVESALAEHGSFDLVILDGDLGDKEYGHEGISGRIINEIIQPNNVKYGRYTGDLTRIPDDLSGLFVVEKGIDRGQGIDQLIKKISEVT